MDDRIKQIRESEKKSHIEFYSNNELYGTDSWIYKPIKTVQEIMPLFKNYNELNVLDLGCGVGRNSIAIASEYKNINCVIDCVDILELAIEKLNDNAKRYGVSDIIKGFVDSIEDYVIEENKYDLIIAVSALEHVETINVFISKLQEMKAGLRQGGVACMVINSEVSEKNKATGQSIPAQFEINLQTDELQSLLKNVFVDWTVLKTTISEQRYEIPRECGISDLNTSVVTFVVRKK